MRAGCSLVWCTAHEHACCKRSMVAQVGSHWFPSHHCDISTVYVAVIDCKCSCLVSCLFGLGMQTRPGISLMSVRENSVRQPWVCERLFIIYGFRVAACTFRCSCFDLCPISGDSLTSAQLNLHVRKQLTRHALYDTALSWVSAIRMCSYGHVVHEVGRSLCSMCRYVLITSFDDQ